MAYYPIAGVFVTASGGTNGASVDGWRASRFDGAIPAEGQTPPSGVADTEVAITGVGYGGPGSFQLYPSTNEQYYVRVQYLGTTYWQLSSQVTNPYGNSGGEVNSYIQDQGGMVCNVKNPVFGATGDGVTDDTAAIVSAIETVGYGGGGTVYFPQGTYLVTSTINLPVTGIESTNVNNVPQTPIYLSAPLRLTGAGGNSTPRGDPPSLGAQIYFNPTANSTLFNGVGEGTLEVDHMALVDVSAQENLFFFVNNTVTNIHDCAFHGNNSFTEAWTDVIYYGGQGAEYPRGDTLGIYQGQVSRLSFNSCTNIRHLAMLFSQASDILISHNGVYNTCGTNQSGDAPIYVIGPGAVGNYFEYNDFEMGSFDTEGESFVRIPNGYAYAIVFNSGYDCMIIGNNVGDANTEAGGGAPPYAVANYYFSSGSTGNTVIQGNSAPISITLPWGAGNTIDNINTIAMPQLISGGAGGTILGPVYAAGAYPFFMQAGAEVVTTNSIGQGVVYFPAQFPNGVLTVQATSYGSGSSPNTSNPRLDWIGQVFNVTSNAFEFYLQNGTGAAEGLPTGDIQCAVTWFAIGF